MQSRHVFLPEVRLQSLLGYGGVIEPLYLFFNDPTHKDEPAKFENLAGITQILTR